MALTVYYGYSLATWCTLVIHSMATLVSDTTTKWLSPQKVYFNMSSPDFHLYFYASDNAKEM